MRTSRPLLVLNFREFSFGHCLEYSRRPLSAPLWRQEATESGLLRLLLAALGAPFGPYPEFPNSFSTHLGEQGMKKRAETANGAPARSQLTLTGAPHSAQRVITFVGSV